MKTIILICTALSTVLLPLVACSSGISTNAIATLPEGITVNSVHVVYQERVDVTTPIGQPSLRWWMVTISINLPPTMQYSYEVGIKLDSGTDWVRPATIPSGAVRTATGAVFTADLNIMASELQSVTDGFDSQRASMQDQLTKLQKQHDLLVYNAKSDTHNATLQTSIGKLEGQMANLQVQISQDNSSFLATYLKSRVVLQRVN